jgi:hypothetical protein
MVSKESILTKTHYGLNIYSHILRLYYPEKSYQREQNSNLFEVMPSAADFARSDQVVMRLVGRDCGLCRNPFNANRETLHIWIEKTDPTNAMSAELSCHNDSANAIPAGDAFDFAELHYKQQGNELLQTLNKELFLHIGEKRNFYANRKAPKILVPRVPHVPCVPVFSFFKATINNIKPHSETTLRKVYNAIKGNYYQERTEKLRAISDVQQARKFKAANFDYCTFSGVFTTRSDKALVKHSDLLCLDFDHLPSVEKLRFQLLQDEYFDTQLLFVSPSGDGLKWIISIDTTATTHGNYFAAVANYILQTYGVAADKSGRDLSRACFLPHDPQAFINPQFV